MSRTVVFFAKPVDPDPSLDETPETSFRWTAKRCSWVVVGRLDEKGKRLRPQNVSGWVYTAHDGVERFSEGNWLQAVSRIRATLEYYGLKADVS